MISTALTALIAVQIAIFPAIVIQGSFEAGALTHGLRYTKFIFTCLCFYTQLCCGYTRDSEIPFTKSFGVQESQQKLYLLTGN